MSQPSNYLPPPNLRSFIANYGVLEVPEGVKEPYLSPPIGLSGFIIQVINSQNIVIAKIGNRDFFSESAVVTGQVTLPVYGELLGHTKSLLVFFQPTGMHRLFRNDMSKLTNHAIPLQALIGKEASNHLLEKLKMDQNTERQIGVLNQFFVGCLPAQKEDGRFEEVLAMIHERQGGITVKEIEKQCHYQRKTLERHFQKMIGLSPKVYIQIYQFKCLLNFLQSNPKITWTELANKTGYYDQSHMSRYFKEYLQTSPNSIVKLDMDLIHYLLRH
ncbi:helix-turn-helix domain-containing protein [Portibacter marinus]|uniref:helix-turn-helix domain-containing protein n=1 Tax=Portibacter marinus TaxID=2898660 RepID=UPI001F4758C3|nr:helix-turn-helix domain-containing protein [Portibacter marinus]